LNLSKRRPALPQESGHFPAAVCTTAVTGRDRERSVLAQFITSKKPEFSAFRGALSAFEPGKNGRARGLEVAGWKTKILVCSAGEWHYRPARTGMSAI
jgi:hypothetical protein